MAALTNAQLPPGFTTLEQFIVYIGIVTSTIYPKDTYLVNETEREKIADTAIINTQDGRDFFVARLAVPMLPDYTTPNNPIWTYADEKGIIDIPTRFLA